MKNGQRLEVSAAISRFVSGAGGWPDHTRWLPILGKTARISGVLLRRGTLDVAILVTYGSENCRESALRDFVSKHSDAAASLSVWRTIVRRAEWKNGGGVTATFSNSGPWVKDNLQHRPKPRYTRDRFHQLSRLEGFIKTILTHKEYEKGDFTK